MDFINKAKKRLPGSKLFSSLQEKRELYNIGVIDLKKAQNGDAESLFDIANKCFSNHWYQGALVVASKLIKRNHGDALRLIGELLEWGHLGFKHPMDAKNWYIKASKNGSSKAFEYLEQRFMDKINPKTLRKLSIECHVKSAVLKNDKVAQFKLGSFFEKGLEVPVDKYSAVIWYQRSAMQGYLPAIERAKQLEKEGYVFLLISPASTLNTTLKLSEQETVVHKNIQANPLPVEYQTIMERLNQLENKMQSINLSNVDYSFISESDTLREVEHAEQNNCLFNNSTELDRLKLMHRLSSMEDHLCTCKTKYELIDI